MNRFTNLFRNDKVLFVLSFFIAVALWMVVISERNPQTANVIRDVAVSYVNTETMDGAGLKIISASNETADVKIFGRLSEASLVTMRNVSVTADMSQINKPGTYEISLAATVDRAGVSVETITPATIQVQADYIVKNKRDVEAKFINNLPDGYEMGDVSLSTTSVTVEGPENTLQKIAKAVAEIDLNNVTDDISGSFPLKLVDANGKEITSNKLTVSTTEVWADVEIIKEKTVPVQIVLDGEVDLSRTGHSVSAQPENVVIKGKKSDVDSIDKIETEPVLRSVIPEEAGTVAAKLRLPTGVTCETSGVSVIFAYDKAGIADGDGQ